MSATLSTATTQHPLSPHFHLLPAIRGLNLPSRGLFLIRQNGRTPVFVAARSFDSREGTKRLQIVLDAGADDRLTNWVGAAAATCALFSVQALPFLRQLSPGLWASSECPFRQCFGVRPRLAFLTCPLIPSRTPTGARRRRTKPAQYGMTALHWACENKAGEAAKMLVQAAAGRLSAGELKVSTTHRLSSAPPAGRRIGMKK